MPEEAKSQPECGRLSARDALTEAAAETTNENVRERRWLFLFVGIFLSIIFVVVGATLALYQNGIEANIAGIVTAGIGVAILLGSVNSYRKAGHFVTRYDQLRSD